MTDARSFVMFFDEKEGTSPIVRLLDRFPKVDVIHQADGGGWEPFDRHNCGAMPLPALVRCLDGIFAGEPISAVNTVYQRYATGPLHDPGLGGSRGFKMRFEPPRRPPVPRWIPAERAIRARLRARADATFSKAMLEVLVRHRVLVLLAVRQDLFRWALSKYHGDGTARPGHLQFRLADGSVQRDEIPRVQVDPAGLEAIIGGCEEIHDRKQRLAATLTAAGVEVLPVRYEDFLAAPVELFAAILDALGQRGSTEEVRSTLAAGSGLERVHGDDLAEFFVNADELTARFGDRFRAWPTAL